MSGALTTNGLGSRSQATALTTSYLIAQFSAAIEIETRLPFATLSRTQDLAASLAHVGLMASLANVGGVMSNLELITTSHLSTLSRTDDKSASLALISIPEFAATLVREDLAADLTKIGLLATLSTIGMQGTLDAIDSHATLTRIDGKISTLKKDII